MKINIISSSLFPCNPNWYGSEVQNAYLADELGKLGHKVTLFATPQSIKGSYELKLIPSSYGKVSIEHETVVYEDKEYRKILLDSDYLIDCSASCYTSEQLYWWHREILYKDLVLVYFRNGVAFNAPRYCNRFIHGVALSKFARNIAIKTWGIPPDKIHYIYYGIDTNLYAYSDKKEDYILYLGRPHWHKGIQRIIMIAEKMPNERFFFAWRALTDEHKRYEKLYKKIVKQKGLRNVEFIELPPPPRHCKAKIELYQRAKAFITPLSLRPFYGEAFGLTIVEAMSCGTPVIGANHSSHVELIQNGANGFRCSSVKDFINVIKRIHEVEPRACRKTVEERFTIQRMANNYLQLYEELKC